MRPVLKMPTKTISPYESDKRLRHQLIDAAGAYCVYCESPLSVDIPPGRKVSVADESETITIDGQLVDLSIGINRRQFDRAWVNQQLMCTACFRAKGEKPGMSEAIQFLQTNADGLWQTIKPKLVNRQRLADTDWETLFTAAALSWLSPDLSTDEMGQILYSIPGDYTFNLFTYTKVSYTPLQLYQNGWLNLTPSERLQTWANTAQTMVWVTPNTPQIQQFQNQNPHQPDLNTRVLATLKGLNLNYHNPTLTDGKDRRVINRTQAWDVVNNAWTKLDALVKQLVQAQVDVNQVLFTPAVSSFVTTIRHTLQTVGFWSLWATIFQANLQNPTSQPWQTIPALARNLLLTSLLIEHEIDTRFMAAQVKLMAGTPIGNDLIAIRSVLPGTDISRLTFLG